MTIADKELACREIVTKAVCGKGRKFSRVTHTVNPPHQPTNILGAWIINHHYEAVKTEDGVEIAGTYDINVWYSHSRNTKTDVAKETVSYVESVPMTYLDPNYRRNTAEVSAVATQEPHCLEASVTSGGGVIVRVEREFQVELVAETKVCVVVCPGGCEEGAKDFDFPLDVDTDADDFEDLDPDLLDDGEETYSG